ncbi:protein FRG1 [Cimex lectularius]|uniref:Protein FRG1 homolog n=1 Tax=Cimex lectularius TaxID=79782 RepID=A0A8I6SEH9_CIMLE|nr:protein FRG1 [Cimex lectularius]
MSEYSFVKKGKLVLKGEKSEKKKKKKKKDKDRKINDNEETQNDEDRSAHGGWGKVFSVKEIIGPVAIEFVTGTYVKALDNGLFTLGAPHDHGEGPAPEEILTAVPVNETKVAFKSGYDKYLGVNKNGIVTGRADAIGPLEQWEPVFQDGKMALLSSSNCFMCLKDEDDSIAALNTTAGEKEMLSIRSQKEKVARVAPDMPSEEMGSVKEIERNYV